MNTQKKKPQQAVLGEDRLVAGNFFTHCVLQLPKNRGISRNEAGLLADASNRLARLLRVSLQ